MARLRDLSELFPEGPNASMRARRVSMVDRGTPRIELTWGDMPSVAAFRKHVLRARDHKGALLLNPEPPVLVMELNLKMSVNTAEEAVAVLEASNKCAPEVVRFKGTRPAGEVVFQNVCQIRSFVTGLVQVNEYDHHAGVVARATMWAVGYDWEWPGVSRIAEVEETRLSVRDLEDWIDNDEGLYDWWKSSKLSKRAFIKQNRSEIKAAIDAVMTGKKRQHHLKYG